MLRCAECGQAVNSSGTSAQPAQRAAGPTSPANAEEDRSSRRPAGFRTMRSPAARTAAQPPADLQRNDPVAAATPAPVVEARSVEARSAEAQSADAGPTKAPAVGKATAATSEFVPSGTMIIENLPHAESAVEPERPRRDPGRSSTFIRMARKSTGPAESRTETKPGAKDGAKATGKLAATDGETKTNIEIAKLKEATAEKKNDRSNKPLSFFQFRNFTKAMEVGSKDGPKAAEQRKQAIEQMGQFTDERIPPLLYKALTDQWVIVREAAIRTLLLFPSDATAAALVERLEKDDSVDIRRASVQALAVLGAPAAVPALLKTGLEHPQQRNGTMEAIVKIGGPAVPQLVKVLAAADPGLRLDACVVLGRIGDQQAAKPLLTALKDPVPIVRAHAAEALGKIGLNDTCAEVAALLEDSDAGVRLNAAAALAQIGDERVRPQILALLNDPEPAIRSYAATAASRLGANTTWSSIVALLKEPDEEVRIRAATALGPMKDPRSVAALCDGLSDNSVKVRMAITESLGQIGGEDAIDALTVALKDQQPMVRKRALEALAEIGTVGARDEIGKVLRGDNVPDVRQSAARMLGQFPDADTIVLLKEALSDEFMVRVRACVSLGEMGLEEAGTVLLGLLKDPVSEIRFHAANGLGAMGDKRALKTLEEMLFETDSLVLRGVGKALLALGDSRGEEALTRSAELAAEQAATRERTPLPATRKKPVRPKPAQAGPSVSIGARLMVVPNFFLSLLPNSMFGMASGLRGAGGNFLEGLSEISPQQLGVAGGGLAACLLVGLGVWHYFFGSNIGSIIDRGNVVSIEIPSEGELLMGMSTGKTELWKVGNKSPSAVYDIPARRMMQFSPDRKTLAVVDSEGNDVHLYDGSTMKEKGKVSGHAARLVLLAFSADSSKLTTGSMDGLVMVSDVNTQQAVEKLQVDFKGSQTVRGTVRSLALSGPGDMLAIGTTDGKVVLKKFPKGEDFVTIPAHSVEVVGVAFSPDGTRLVTNSQDGLSHLWNITSRKREKTLPARGGIAGGQMLRFSADGKKLYFSSGSRYGVFDIEAEKNVRLAGADLESIDLFQVSADGKLAAATGQSEVKTAFWNIENGQLIGEVGPELNL